VNYHARLSSSRYSSSRALEQLRITYGFSRTAPCAQVLSPSCVSPLTLPDHLHHRRR
jgi:hypothetical protein